MSETEESPADRFERRSKAVNARVNALRAPMLWLVAAWRRRCGRLGRLWPGGDELAMLEEFVGDVETASVALWGEFQREADAVPSPAMPILMPSTSAAWFQRVADELGAAVLVLDKRYVASAGRVEPCITYSVVEADATPWERANAAARYAPAAVDAAPGAA